MSAKSSRFWNVEEIQCFAEDILNRYYLNVEQSQIPKIVENFIYKLSETCAGIFEEDDVWSVLKVLAKNNCLTEEVLKDSSIQKFTKTSNPHLNHQIKDEIMDLATNKIIKHIDKSKSSIREYRTKCYTVDSLNDKVVFGDLISTMEYSENGLDLNQIIEANTESLLDFSNNNLLIKIKEDICDGLHKKYIRIIIVGKIES